MLKKKDYIHLIRLALEEDHAANDITARAIFSKKDTVSAKIISREKGVLAGVLITQDVFLELDSSLRIKFF